MLKKKYKRYLLNIIYSFVLVFSLFVSFCFDFQNVHYKFNRNELKRELNDCDNEKQPIPVCGYIDYIYLDFISFTEQQIIIYIESLFDIIESDSQVVDYAYYVLINSDDTKYISIDYDSTENFIYIAYFDDTISLEIPLFDFYDGEVIEKTELTYIDFNDHLYCDIIYDDFSLALYNNMLPFIYYVEPCVLPEPPRFENILNIFDNSINSMVDIFSLGALSLSNIIIFENGVSDFAVLFLFFCGGVLVVSLSHFVVYKILSLEGEKNE